jgi:hypothetical protein
MPPFNNYQAFFVHISKTAGTSIETGVFGLTRQNNNWLRRNRAHLTIPELRNKGSMEPYEDYFKFTFIRNPWDRLVSAYYHGYMHEDMSFKKWLFEKAVPLKEQLYPKGEFVIYTSRKMDHVLLSPQYRYVYNSVRCKEQVVDFIGRFENLEDDWIKVADRLGVQRNLPKINKKEKSNYQYFYDSESIDTVADMYEFDIKLFSYKFD